MICKYCVLRLTEPVKKPYAGLDPDNTNVEATPVNPEPSPTNEPVNDEPVTGALNLIDAVLNIAKLLRFATPIPLPIVNKSPDAVVGELY